MSAPDLSLLSKRRFAPVFVVQFLGAFNDNLLKFALLFMASFGTAFAPGDAERLAALSTGLFILPYFLFSGLAGRAADTMDKATLIRLVKACEIGIMAFALWGLTQGSTGVLLTCLFLMGVHSTVFGPVKYAILPQHLGPHELVGGTGLVEAGTFLAILGGQLYAGVAAPVAAGATALVLSVLGLLAAFAVPRAPSVSGLAMDWRPITTTVQALAVARRGRGVWLSILGISWFFAVGAVLVSEFAPLVTGTFGSGRGVVTLFLLVFSVSTAVGSVIVGRLLGGEVSARYVPISALALSGFILLLWASCLFFRPVGDLSVNAFLSGFSGWAVLFSLAGLAISGGMFIVPLYAILQAWSDPAERARTIAANNVVNAVVTVLVVAIVYAMLGHGCSVPDVIAFMGFSTLGVALASCWLLPDVVFKGVVKAVLSLLYGVKVVNPQGMPREGEAAVVVVNHVSFLDGLLLAAFLPGRPTFAVATKWAAKWFMRPLARIVDIFPVDPMNPMSAKAMVKAVKEGRTLVIFPEGRITVTGSLMKVFDGPGMVADKADAPIVPVRIDGAQYTPFSRTKGKVRQRWFPRITLTVLDQHRFDVSGGSSARERRAIAGRMLYDVMSGMMFETSCTDATLFEALLDARDVHGAGMPVLEDVKRQPLAYGRLVVGALALGRRMSEITEPDALAISSGPRNGEAERASVCVGLLLPNVNAAVVSFFGLQAFGRVPAMLNFTAGLSALRSACRAARIRTVFTSRAFVEQAKLGSIVEGLSEGGDVRVVFLEDVAPSIGFGRKMRAFAEARFARSLHARLGILPDDPAVVLFTSGSEGEPKGVVLSHRNLTSNCAQLRSRIDFNSSDIVLNALPVFHSFGLTGGTLLPILSGVRTIMYPSPLHYRIVPALAYDSNATIMFGTDTFLGGYARMAHPYDFHSLRYVFAGAEKVKDETRRTWSDKFGVRILEGYGATECSPVIAVNTPMHFAAGSVGRMLPGMKARFESVPGIDRGERLSVSGPNVMLGYYKADRPGVLQPPPGGWHDLGDIVTVNDMGAIFIEGRAKRFAKIGGEMISLPAVEGYAGKVWPQAEHAVVTRPDPRKGEQLVLFTTAKGARQADLAAWAKANGVAEISVPRDVRVLDGLPVLGTGKIDYVTMGGMAADSAPKAEPVAEDEGIS